MYQQQWSPEAISRHCTGAVISQGPCYLPPSVSSQSPTGPLCDINNHALTWVISSELAADRISAAHWIVGGHGDAFVGSELERGHLEFAHQFGNQPDPAMRIRLHGFQNRSYCLNISSCHLC